MSQDHPYEIPIHRPIRDAYIKFIFEDKLGAKERTFESVQTLAEFLKYNEEPGKMVGYTPKRNSR
ncbi:MAG TPA: hypothetical protein DGG95_17805 [Cytophagales bacterium]|jgi:hypothetical protein|nr:hypothetical protein [Cytophagales bacterium]